MTPYKTLLFILLIHLPLHLPAAADSLFIPQDSLFKHLFILGNNSMEGRAAGTPGAEKAVAYIISRLKKYGLQSPPGIKDFRQEVPMHSSLPLPDSRLRLHNPDGIYDFELGADYVIHRAVSQSYLPNPLPLVFAGYGITAPEFDYDDYQGVDVKGKLAVVLAGEPSSNEPDYFNGRENTVYSLPEAKQRMAIASGAAGTIIVRNPKLPYYKSWERVQRDYAFTNISLAYTTSTHLSLIMNIDAARRLFHGAAYSLKQVFAMDSTAAMHSFPLARKMSFRGEFIERDFISHNIAAVIPGSDPSLQTEYVLLSAHYDHLGIGPAVAGDSIYNGVIDNAIGVSGLLELAG
ncbi:MAG: M28 family peptidase, partial [Calditrichia bacterium]